VKICKGFHAIDQLFTPCFVIQLPKNAIRPLYITVIDLEDPEFSLASILYLKANYRQ